jgi:tripartite-type tricarboxylate transporter receptor subunit TctC
VIRLLLVLAALAAAAQAWAQYPTKPIRLIVPAAPGGGTDITARSFVPALAENLGQPIVIENRGGAGGSIGSDIVAKAAPDGYTLLMVYVSHATNPTLITKLPYDTLRDFTPIVLISHEPTVLVTHPSVPANSLAEFIAWAKEGAAKGKLSYATDPGSAGFLAGELFKQATGLGAIDLRRFHCAGQLAGAPSRGEARARRAARDESHRAGWHVSSRLHGLSRQQDPQPSRRIRSGDTAARRRR